MKIKRFTLMLVLSLVLSLLMSSAVFAAGPVTLDFNSLPTGTFTEQQEDGFLIHYIGFGDLPTISDVDGNKVLKDSAYNVYGAEVYINSLDGGNFYFNSLDYNNFNNNNGYYRIDVTAFPYPFSWDTAIQIRLYPTSSAFSTLTSTALGLDGIELCQLRVNNVSGSADYSVDNICLTHVPKVVNADIKPGSDQNSINLKNKGVVPVAVLGSADFDVSQIDVSTVVFAGAPALEIGGGLEDVNGDGYMDTVFHFFTQELDLDVDDTEATLSGQISGGQEFSASDSVRIVK